jgi:signal transduction histidine kinase
MDDPVAAAAVAGRQGNGVLYRFAHVTSRPLARDNWLARASTYRFDGLGIDWVVVTAMPESFFFEGIQAGHSQSALVFVVALLMALVFAAWLASRVSGPLERLSEAAGALASGDLAARVPRTHLRELDELGRSFNEMAGRLQTSFSDLATSEQELRGHRDHLNDLVADRTAELSVVAARAESAYQQLRDLENLRDNLVQMVVHDMRSPLMVLMANIESVQHSCAALGRQVSVELDDAMNAVQSLTGMANDLLDVSRLETGKMPIDRRQCDLVALARRVRDALASVDRGRMLILDGDASVASECDSRIVQRVLENLVSNAIKHTPAGGTVRIVVSASPAANRVAVEDDGPGVPEEARHRIFEKFGRVDALTTTKYHSAGLGLTFCKLAVEAHGGQIGVDAGASRGSVFWFELPSGHQSQNPSTLRH